MRRPKFHIDSFTIFHWRVVSLLSLALVLCCGAVAGEPPGFLGRHLETIRQIESIDFYSTVQAGDSKTHFRIMEMGQMYLMDGNDGSGIGGGLELRRQDAFNGEYYQTRSISTNSTTISKSLPFGEGLMHYSNPLLTMHQWLRFSGENSLRHFRTVGIDTVLASTHIAAKDAGGEWIVETTRNAPHMGIDPVDYVRSTFRTLSGVLYPVKVELFLRDGTLAGSAELVRHEMQTVGTHRVIVPLEILSRDEDPNGAFETRTTFDRVRLNPVISDEVFSLQSGPAFIITDRTSGRRLRELPWGKDYGWLPRGNTVGPPDDVINRQPPNPWKRRLLLSLGAASGLYAIWWLLARRRRRQ